MIADDQQMKEKDVLFRRNLLLCGVLPGIFRMAPITVVTTVYPRTVGRTVGCTGLLLNSDRESEFDNIGQSLELVNLESGSERKPEGDSNGNRLTKRTIAIHTCSFDRGIIHLSSESPPFSSSLHPAGSGLLEH